MTEFVRSIRKYNVYLLEDKGKDTVLGAKEHYNLDGSTVTKFRAKDGTIFNEGTVTYAKDINEYVKKLGELFGKPFGYMGITPGTYPKTIRYRFYFKELKNINGLMMEAITLKDALSMIFIKLGVIPPVYTNDEDYMGRLKPLVINHILKDNPELWDDIISDDKLFVDESHVIKG